MKNLGKWEFAGEKFYEAKKELLAIYNFYDTKVDNSEKNKKLLSLKTIQEKLKDGEYLAILSANIDLICDCVAFIYTMTKDEDVLLSSIANDFFYSGKIQNSLFTALHIGELLDNKHKDLTQNGD